MIGLAAAASVFGSGLDIPRAPTIVRAPQVTYLDRAGGVIGVRGGRYGPPVNVDALPSYVPAAFIAIEDRRFYEHGGVDPLGIARAVVSDLVQGRAAEGASTITQQLARNLYLSSQRTLERKGEEMLLALELERSYSKKQILGLYLSRVYFGAGAYGLEAAARRFFDKPARKLTVREAAMLAALMKSPVNYSPIDQPAASAQRTALVLDAMVASGAITAAQARHAATQTPRVWRDDPIGPAQYFIDWLEARRAAVAPNPSRDLLVDTTLDAAMETAASGSLRAAIERHAGQGVQQGALVALDGEGAVRAMVGGRDYAAGPYNRAVSAHRQAGSAWKPFVYLAAMEAGRTPETPAIDQPVTIEGWSPRNFDPGYLGPVTLAQALAHSINTVAAQLAEEIGRDRVAAAARRLGITSPINTDPAMALGTSQVTPLEMARAYDAFANGGDRVEPYGLVRIRTTAGTTIYRGRPAAPQPAINNPPLTEMNAMLRGVVASGTGARAALPGHDLAGKTGTTSDFKDAWYCGYTGGFTAVVWLGRDDARPMRGITGGSAPVDAWRGFMSAALRRVPDRPIPAGPPAPAPISASDTLSPSPTPEP